MMWTAVVSALSVFLVTYSKVIIPFTVSWFGYIIILAVYLAGIYILFVNLYHFFAIQNAKVTGEPDEQESAIGFIGGEA